MSNSSAEGQEVRESQFGLDPDQFDAVMDMLHAENWVGVCEKIESLHGANIADFLENITHDERHALIEVMRDRINPEVLAELDETVREKVIEQLGPQEAAAVITELETDDAVSVIEDLEEAAQQEILQEIPEEDRVIIQDSLSYPEETAGRLMQRELVSVPAFWTVGEVIDFLRTAEDLPRDFYDLFIIDPRHHPVGSVPLSRVLRSERPVRVEEIMDVSPDMIPVFMDQEEVAFLFRQLNLTSAPVIDDGGRLVGVITVDDVLDIIDEEASEDIMRLGGVSEEDFYGALVDTTRSRFSWLLFNLMTAFLASFVISFFEGAIERLVALAVLMPIVASMGGNAGTQSMTVAVRALAMKELTSTNAFRAVRKEVLVSAINGVFFAVLTGIAAGWWFHDAGIGAVIAAAMLVNLVVAGLAGTMIPMGLNRFGVDPAIASGTFLTTVTDVVGFLVFLGLAAFFLL